MVAVGLLLQNIPGQVLKVGQSRHPDAADYTV